MIKLDGTDNKGKLGANAILAVSMAIAKVGALFNRNSRYVKPVVECTQHVVSGGQRVPQVRRWGSGTWLGGICAAC